MPVFRRNSAGATDGKAQGSQSPQGAQTAEAPEKSKAAVQAGKGRPTPKRSVAEANRYRTITGATTSGRGPAKAPDPRRKLTGQTLNPFNALGLGAQLLVEDDVLEFRQAIFKSRLQIGLIEKLRIRQPRPNNALVAGDDGFAAVTGLQVGDQDEFVDQLGVRGVAQDETFLVVADGGADHFLGDVQEFLVERAHQHHRPFDEA